MFQIHHNGPVSEITRDVNTKKTKRRDLKVNEMIMSTNLSSGNEYFDLNLPRIFWRYQLKSSTKGSLTKSSFLFGHQEHC